MLTTEESVKNMLGVTDWRKVTKEQIIQFASNIQNMTPEVAKECIQQMPAFKEQSTTIVKYFYDLCNTELKRDSAAIESYKAIISDLQEQLQKTKLTKAERQFIIEQMVYLGERIENVEVSNNRHKRTVIQVAGVVGGFAIAVCAAILGGKIEIPFRKS